MEDLIVLLAVFGGCLAVGYVLIMRVPPLLHTPLMSLTNAVSAVTLLGALLLFAEKGGWGGCVLGAVAIVAAMFNIVGGFAITGRMVRMFRKH